ncbi:probable RNA polymerase sigma factor Y [Lentisphaera araneosa HTCC2155]|uniref:Probable RNA polymerase sigma factor Y n=1 Tax=Lentisphaera araneosa HTCC2155 TaxID=313628 RepID=A6DRW3_9BACT|nr:sigma-70 family RNA polymerase sigma factor [Lentisphaera araneosa]EDM25648.1 probable RNA polymerase sigma factor Y [Lentisphaera araneosa HTCC2155]
MSKEYNTRQTLLCKLIDSNDEKSWDDFVKYYEGYIYVVICNFNVDEDTAEDLLQDVLLKIWKSLPKYEYRKGECTFRTWLCLVIKSIVFNHFRKRSTKNQNQNISHEELLNNLESITEPEIDKIAELEWKSYISSMAWENIKSEFNASTIEVFELSLEQDDNALIAKKFAISVSSVRVYKSRVRKVLLREMSRLNEELGG